jgi:quercetin dioxygenase-like cupin family protein
MHNTTHIDAPAHVVQGTPFIDEVPLPHFFGSGIVVSIPKKKWESITYDDLEKAAGSAVRPRDVVIVNTGWHKVYEDNEDYFCRAPGFVPSAGKWFVEKKVKVVGHDTQANDHPLATAIGPQRNGPLQRHLGHRERRRRHRQGHRQALHLRAVSLELGARRRLHHSPGRHRRPQGRLSDREGGEVLMEVKHLSEAKPYEAPNHRGYSSLRLFGLDAGGPKQFTLGLSHFLPGGGAGPDASPTEKVYYVLAGELTLIAGGKQTVLKANDACFIGPNESREIVNRGNEVVTMLVAVSTPQK